MKQKKKKKNLLNIVKHLIINIKLSMLLDIQRITHYLLIVSKE